MIAKSIRVQPGHAYRVHRSQRTPASRETLPTPRTAFLPRTLTRQGLEKRRTTSRDRRHLRLPRSSTAPSASDATPGALRSPSARALALVTAASHATMVGPERPSQLEPPNP